MNVAHMQLLQNPTCIFVSFSGVKARLPQTETLVKEPLLHIQLDQEGALQTFAFVNKAALLRASFVAKRDGEVLPYIMKVKQPEQLHREDEELILPITRTLSIVVKETEHSYEYILVQQLKETAFIAKRKGKRRRPESMKREEQLLFIVPKISKAKKTKGHKKIGAFIRQTIVAQDHKKKSFRHIATRSLYEAVPIRILEMRKFEGMIGRGTVYKEFIGPGDQMFPLPRAEPHR